MFNGFINWINTLPAVTSTGFTPNVLQVVLLYSGIVFCLYHWGKRNIRLFKWGISSLFILSITLISTREYNKSKSELIVFNNYKKVILLKSNRKLFLLYNSKNAPSISGLDYLVHGYEVSVGVKCEKIPLPLKSKISFSKDLYFKNLKSGIKIDYFGRKLFLADQVSNALNSDYTIVKGAWNPYLSSEKTTISTTDKALILKAKGKQF